MKIPEDVEPCLKNNMPVWAERVKKAKSVSELQTISKDNDDESHALANYDSCFVGEFWGFKKQAQEKYEAYEGCGSCFDYSMQIYRAYTMDGLFQAIKNFCEHAKVSHPEHFKTMVVAK